MNVKTENGVKSLELENGEYLHFWYANNAGRGNSNVTVILSTIANRAAVSAKQTGVISSIKTSGWHGNVNLSKRVFRELGL